MSEVEVTKSSPNCGNALLDAVLIKEGNKLIAKFMGVDFDESDFMADRSLGGNADAVRYHRAWDWLMPVCKKINDLPAIDGKWEIMQDLWDEIDGAVTRNYDIEETYTAVLDFIKWYNQNTAKV